MEFDSKRPIYIQIEDLIKLRIIRGDYSPGDKLMSIRDIAKEMNVSIRTVETHIYNALKLIRDNLKTLKLLYIILYFTDITIF